MTLKTPLPSGAFRDVDGRRFAMSTRTRLLGLMLWLSAAIFAQPQDEIEPREVVNPDAPLEMEMIEVEAVASRPWLYARLPGVEVLSLASKGDTERFVEEVQRRWEFLQKLVPELADDPEYPLFTVILQSPAFLKIRDAGGPLYKSRAKGATEFSRSFSGGVDMNIKMFGDHSTQPRGTFREDEISHAAGLFFQHFRKELIERQPRLPRWYREGALECGIQESFDQEELEWNTWHSFTLHRETLRAWKLVGPDSANLRTLPLAKLLSISEPSAEAMKYVFNRIDSPGERVSEELSAVHRSEMRIWRDQCALFFHWGLRGGGEEQRKAFRRLVAAAAERRVDEAMFTACFGFGFEEGQRRFDEFVRREVALAIKHGSSRKSQVWPKPGKEMTAKEKRAYEDARRPDYLTIASYQSRDAGTRRAKSVYDFLTKEQPKKKKSDSVEVASAEIEDVWRIMAEAYLWGGIRATEDEISFTSHRSSFAYRYRQQRRVVNEACLSRARELLYRLHDRGVRNPQLLVALGNLERVSREPEKAAQFLREAIDTGQARSSAYYTLAKLTLDGAGEAASENGAARAKEQTERAITLSREAVTRSPEVWPAYGVLAAAWRRAGEIPPDSDLALLARSVRWFPENVEATCDIAILFADAGKPKEAAELAQIGVDWLPLREVQASIQRDLKRLAKQEKGSARP